MRALFLLTILCAVPASAQDTVATPLDHASQGMRGTRSLEAVFRQEKRIPFLDLPLVAEGKLCFHVPRPHRPISSGNTAPLPAPVSSMRGTPSTSGPRDPERMSRRRKKAF